MYSEQTYNSLENMLSPYQTMLPFDHDLAFETFAEGIDASSAGRHLFDNNGKDIDMGNITGLEEPGGASCVPFNPELSLIDQDVESFNNSLGGMEMDFDMASGSVNNMENGNSDVTGRGPAEGDEQALSLSLLFEYY